MGVRMNPCIILDLIIVISQSPLIERLHPSHTFRPLYVLEPRQEPQAYRRHRGHLLFVELPHSEEENNPPVS